MKMKTLAALALATLPLSFQATAEDWYPSAYGANDEIGAANLLTADVVKHAVSLVRTGKTYPLAVPVDKNPRVPPPQLPPVQRAGRPAGWQVAGPQQVHLQR